MSSSNTDAYEPPESLWELIKQSVKECELEVIKSAIGESLVDQSVELHEEVNTLLDIWRDYRDETTSSLNYLRQSSATNRHALPEPPDQRERLVKEINFFLKQLREKCDAKAFQKQLTKHNLNVINYVLSTASTKYEDSDAANMMMMGDESRMTPKCGVQRPGTSMSKSGMETPCMTTFRAANNCSKMSSTLEIVEDKLNCTDIDDIVDHLRQVLQSEIDSLLKDIDFLYECLDKESEYRLQSNRDIKEPTLTELKEERKRLEDNVLVDGATVHSKSRPSSNNSVSSISLSLKSPSPTPFSSRQKVTTTDSSSSAALRSKMPLTLTSLSGVNNNTNTSSKLRSTAAAATPASTRNNTFTIKPRTTTTTTTTRNVINRSTDNLAAISPTPSSASSRTSSVSSMIRSKILVQPVNSKQNAAEKFRKMVLESRDTS